MQRHSIVLLRDGTHRFECDGDQALLDAAEEAGLVDLPWGCRSGVCGSCVARLTRGRVEQSSQMALDAEHEQSGWVVMCVATPQTNVEIEYEERGRDG